MFFENVNEAAKDPILGLSEEFNKDKINPNILFWFYECALLQNLGFKPDLEINHFPGIDLPDIHREKKTISLWEIMLKHEH